ncbi:MAG: flagellar biosynthesis anti-sigma factor FlgM [Candidatus Hydrogenedentes bacterium]|nr:flagellar biosynthesis anti-sigma factor FlgM [Candidatus Hydrogenedentota bacterium]
MTGLTPIIQVAAAGPAGGYGSRRGVEAAGKAAAGGDAVAISESAQRAADAAAYAASNTGDNVRADLVARAKENLEEGTYRLQQVVLQVASRVGDLIN